MGDFSDFIKRNDLIDPPLSKSRFTWSNNHSKSRLDRFLFSISSEDLFPRVAQLILPKIIFDHSPILLESGKIVCENRPFKFENMWLQVEGFEQLVSKWWKSYAFTSYPSYVMSCKQKALKYDLIKWNKEVFGRVEVAKENLLNDIKMLDKKEDFSLSDEEKIQREESRRTFSHLAHLEEISWRQKSRELWLKDGDKNTKYFHQMAISHRRRNFVSKINIDGEVVVDGSVITRHIAGFYKKLYTEEFLLRPVLDGLDFDKITEEDAASIERDMSEEEVFEAITDLDGDKSPGPDGFSIAFFQKCWGVIKDDLMSVIVDFSQKSTFVKNMNATFLSMIPKKVGAEEVRDY